MENSLSLKFFLKNYYVIDDKKPNLDEEQLKEFEEFMEYYEKGYELVYFYGRKRSKFIWVKNTKNGK